MNLSARYKEAKLVSGKLEALMAKENSMFAKEKDDKMKLYIDRLIARHQTERNKLKSKLDLDLKVLQKVRKSGLDNINHKYKNKKINLENQQKNEKVLIENNNLQRASKI